MYAELNACMRKRLGACMTVLCLPGWRFIPTVAGTRLLQCKSVHIIWFASQARHLYSSCLTWPCISKHKKPKTASATRSPPMPNMTALVRLESANTCSMEMQIGTVLKLGQTMPSERKYFRRSYTNKQATNTEQQMGHRNIIKRAISTS